MAVYFYICILQIILCAIFVNLCSVYICYKSIEVSCLIIFEHGFVDTTLNKSIIK